jgi:GNAT superfamily N-acetyltransferase
VTRIAIRFFVPGDEARLQQIRLAAFPDIFESFHSLLGPDVAAIVLANAETEQRELLDGFFAAQPDKQVLVASLNGESIGFAALTYDRVQAIGEIVLTAVDPAFMGKGAGTKLALAALHAMKAQGMQVATVGTGGDDSHAAARRAYGKAGFARFIPNMLYYRTLGDLPAQG